MPEGVLLTRSLGRGGGACQLCSLSGLAPGNSPGGGRLGRGAQASPEASKEPSETCRRGTRDKTYSWELQGLLHVAEGPGRRSPGSEIALSPDCNSQSWFPGRQLCSFPEQGAEESRSPSSWTSLVGTEGSERQEPARRGGAHLSRPDRSALGARWGGRVEWGPWFCWVALGGELHSGWGSWAPWATKIQLSL